MIIYRELHEKEVELDLFTDFDRTQAVTECWRKTEGKWEIRSVPFIDNWTEAEYREVVRYLKN